MEMVYGLKIEFQFIRNNGRVLGETVFEDATVPIYEREGGEGYKLVRVQSGNGHNRRKLDKQSLRRSFPLYLRP